MADITFEIDDALGVVTIARPPLNLFTWQMLDELSNVLDEAAASPVRALLLKAGGSHFSAGADVRPMFEGLSARAAEAYLARYVPLMKRMQDIPIPTMAAVRGMCLTAGMEIALRCDLLWASETAQFAHLEATIGTTTLLGGAQILVERAGPARAAEICYSASLYGAADFEKWGIVTRMVPDPDLDDASLRFARGLASGPTKALKAIKRLIRTAAEDGVSAADDLVGLVGAPLLETQDMQAGVQALAKYGPRDFRAKLVFQGK